MFKYKTEAELTAMTPEQRDIYSEQKREWEATQTKEQIKTALDAFKTANMPVAETEAEKTTRLAAEKLKDDELKELKETVQQLKENSGGTGSKSLSIEKQIETESEKIKEAIKGKRAHEFTVKANVVAGSVTGNTSAQDIPGIGQLAHRKLTVYDMFRKIPVGKDANGVVRYWDWDEATKVRAAAAILEAGTFPESTAKWAEYTIALQKVGDSIPVSEEFAYDNARFAAELEAFLRTNVEIKIDTDLITANGTAPNIKGLTNQVGTFTAAASSITDANIYDLIVKVYESISATGGSKYQPNVALMNITDINKMKLKKDSQNNYIMPPFATVGGTMVDGVLVLECNSVTANTMFVGDSRYGAIYEEPGFYVAAGYDGADWTSDMMTLKARKRLNLLIRTVDQTGWKKVTSISAALTTLAT